MNKNIRNEKEINYDVLKKIKEHAKKYDEVADKKQFLKDVSAYEQKLILLSSKRPYEVLNYLDELDLKSSKLILNELTYDEIKKILELFTLEDKKKFYNTFSDLELVNQFIIQDKASSDYLEELPIDRKVKLLDSADTSTVLASTKIYESIPDEQRDLVSQSITTSDGISALSEAANNVEEQPTEEVIEEKQENNEVIEEEQLTEEVIEEEQENKKEKEKIEEDKQIEENSVKEIEIPKENQSEVEYYEKYSIIGNGQSYVSITSDSKANELFDQVKQTVENIQIEQIMNQVKKDSLEVNNEKAL